MDTASEHDLDLREARLRRLTGSIPHALLAVSTILTLITETPSQEQLPITLGLVALAATLLWTMTGPNHERTFRPRLRGVFVAALIIMIAVLGARSIWFAGFFGFTGYVYSWQFLPGRWKFVGVTATAAVTVPAYLGGPPDPTPSSILLYLFFIASVVVLVAVFSRFGDITAERSHERQLMVERLRETIRENEDLHTQLLTQARRAGMHEERQRMAREIHDTLAQGFVGIITQLQAAQQAKNTTEQTTRNHPENTHTTGKTTNDTTPAQDNHTEWRIRTTNALHLARENLTEARRSVHALGPGPLETTPLPDALADLTTQWSRLNEIHADLTTTGPARPLHQEVETALLRTAQETLTNVAKHAHAGRVGVTLTYMEDTVTLDVRDDGAGFSAPPEETPYGPENTPADNDTNGGFGLRSIRQRVHHLAGTLKIESEPGTGTAISATVPAITRKAPGG